jgi:YHS domain-containing protein
VSYQRLAGDAAKNERKYAHSFCSRACVQAHRVQPKKHGACKHCGGALSGKDQKVFCGRACYDAFRRGPDTSPQAYGGPFLRLKPLVLARDERTCAMTGGARALEVHHIDHDPQNNIMENLITLSRAAHAQYHAMPAAQQGLWRRMFGELAKSRTSS